MPDLVWYASYGSNLMRSRFLTYIQGGLASGASQAQIGCTDKTSPRAERRILMHHGLYFAQSSSQWENGGVAFVEANSRPDARTLGRMYLIGSGQFEEVVLQENGVSEYGDGIDLDYEGIQRDGAQNVLSGWYGRILCLGEEGGFPIYTFTTPEDPRPDTFNPPGPKYLTTIIKGLQESYPVSTDAIVEYLGPTPGIKDQITEAELEILARQVSDPGAP